MILYIDPGTGSMLFAILIGIIGAASYIFKGWLLKIKFFLTGGKKVESKEEKIPIVIFSDDKRYWNIFKPICRELNNRDIDVVYYTASPDDDALENDFEHIDAQFIGEGNKAFAKLNFLNANIVLSTTPGLDVFQWKRSKNVDCYVHIFHAASDVTAYRMFGLEFYDSLLISGEYQRKDIRELERLRKRPKKEIESVGLPYMDDMAERLNKYKTKKDNNINVLVAPTWGKNSILNVFGDEIIDKLLETGYKIIIRPHPQSFKSEAEEMQRLMNKYPQLEWNRDNDNFEVLNRADILISDYSGVMFDFALVYDKPVIYAGTDFDYSPYDAWWLDRPLWTFGALKKMGLELTKENYGDIKNIIDLCLTDKELEKGREQARNETWEHRGKGAQRAADYIENKLKELTKSEGAD